MLRCYCQRCGHVQAAVQVCGNALVQGQWLLHRLCTWAQALLPAQMIDGTAGRGLQQPWEAVSKPAVATCVAGWMVRTMVRGWMVSWCRRCENCCYI